MQNLLVLGILLRNENNFGNCIWGKFNGKITNTYVALITVILKFTILDLPNARMKASLQQTC